MQDATSGHGRAQAGSLMALNHRGYQAMSDLRTALGTKHESVVVIRQEAPSTPAAEVARSPTGKLEKTVAIQVIPRDSDGTAVPDAREQVSHRGARDNRTYYNDLSRSAAATSVSSFFAKQNRSASGGASL